LAKKVRTPAPPAPRRVQAPKKRTGPRHSAAAAPRRRLLLILAAGAIVALGAIVAGVIVLGGGSDTDVAKTMRAAGCTYKSVVERREVRHVTSLPKGYRYSTNPRTAGLHYPETVFWGAYDDPLDQLRVGHNMEHGGAVIQYGSEVPEATVTQLTAFYQDDPNGLVLAPLPRLGKQISLGAWTFDLGRLNEQGYQGEGRLALCPTFNESAFREFVDEYRYQGPERFEPHDLAPGNS
jgi:hypothetical protein